ncbi:hypothetical protein SAMD00019534_057000, partial [Acytostelium subglobosum LB1]|uniref:hypothetical protein n=1 Tax=Acytostelium subglobosum LB1 TaxID=1410327 RepID=UPI000644F020
TKRSIKPSNMAKSKVVIVGGGYSGVYLAKALDNRCNVTLIERKKLFFHNITALRLVVQPELCTEVFLPMDSLLKNGRVINQLAVEVTPQCVRLEDGAELPFDYLVIATGSNNMTPYKSPVDCSDLYNYYHKLRDTVREAKSVAIVGGTTVGCELASEIACEYPDKKITLVHSLNRLCSHRLGDRFCSKLAKKMTKMGVNVMLNTVVNVPAEEVQRRNTGAVVDYQTRPGQVLETDQGNVDAEIIFWCLGSRPNSEPLRKSFATSIDALGQLKVDEHLRVEGHTNVFAMGDITNISELKTAYNALLHSGVVAKNIKRLDEAGAKHRKLKKYKPSKPLLFLSLGKDNGLSNIPGGIILGGLITSFIKSKSVYISQCRELLNNPKSTPLIGQDSKQHLKEGGLGLGLGVEPAKQDKQEPSSTSEAEVVDQDKLEKSTINIYTNIEGVNV